MPPKVKITKEDIIRTSVDLVRQRGIDAINARAIATALSCSTQPIFSNFATMDELLYDVLGAAQQCCIEYMEREVASGRYPAYKANGMAYIRFAKEEKELFKLLYMRDRRTETFAENRVLTDQMEALVQQYTGLEGDDIALFHLEMWACVHGIAVMFATSYLDLDWELVSKMITDVYQGLRHRYGMEDSNGSHPH